MINQALLEKELKRDNQSKRAQILIDHLATSKTALEAAHDQYEEYLNSASDPYESQLYSFHVARVQKWIHIIANRLHLYYKVTTNEKELPTLALKPEVQNWVISGPTKRTYVLQKHLKQKGLLNNLVKLYPDIVFQPNESWKWSDESAVGMQLWGPPYSAEILTGKSCYFLQSDTQSEPTLNRFPFLSI